MFFILFYEKICMSVHTVCPRSLGTFYIMIYTINGSRFLGHTVHVDLYIDNAGFSLHHPMKTWKTWPVVNESNEIWISPPLLPHHAIKSWINFFNFYNAYNLYDSTLHVQFSSPTQALCLIHLLPTEKHYVGLIILSYQKYGICFWSFFFFI